MTIAGLKHEASKDHGEIHALGRDLAGLIASGQAFRSLRGKELQLGTSDLDALEHLHNHGSMAPKELSAVMGVGSGTMTALLDRVEKTGFIKRERNPDDRRALLIQLTPAGEHAMQWLQEQFQAVTAQALAEAPDLTSHGVQDVLKRLSNSLEQAYRGDSLLAPATEVPTRRH